MELQFISCIQDLRKIQTFGFCIEHVVSVCQYGYDQVEYNHVEEKYNDHGVIVSIIHKPILSLDLIFENIEIVIANTCIENKQERLKESRK